MSTDRHFGNIEVGFAAGAGLLVRVAGQITASARTAVAPVVVAATTGSSHYYSWGWIRLLRC
jgi:hypothetical protein